MKIPTSWKDISISQYRALISIPDHVTEESKIIRTVSILCGINHKQVLKLTPKEILEINNSLEFIKNLPQGTFSERIIVNNQEFAIMPDLNALTMGELLDLEEYLANWNNSIHKIMAIFYRPIVKSDALSYTIEDYDTQRVLKAAEWFDKEVSIETAYAVSVFFSIGVAASLKFMKTYLGQQMTIN